jgi:hypothetical protein
MQLILVKIKWHIKWKYLIKKFHDICLSYYFQLSVNVWTYSSTRIHYPDSDLGISCSWSLLLHAYWRSSKYQFLFDPTGAHIHDLLHDIHYLTDAILQIKKKKIDNFTEN